MDTIDSYFGMRKIKIAPDKTGRLRIMLNGTPVSPMCVLDQVYWLDGLYTAPTDASQSVTIARAVTSGG